MSGGLECFVDQGRLRALNMAKKCASTKCENKRHQNTRYCLEHGKGLAKHIEKRLEADFYVYFIMAAGTGCAKIGFSSNLEKRLANIQGTNPGKVILVASVPGHRELESAIHIHLQEHRVRGEWFELTDDVVDIMAAAKDEGLDGVMRILREGGKVEWMFPDTWRKGLTNTD